MKNAIKNFINTGKENFYMKEKTFKDLGLDDGDKFLEKMSLDIDLGDLDKVLNDNDDEEELKNRIKEINERV